MDTSRVTYVYDIAQFYNFLTLAKASKQYLPKEFHKIDSSNIRDFKTIKNTFKFFEAHKEEIIEYWKEHKEEVDKKLTKPEDSTEKPAH